MEENATFGLIPSCITPVCIDRLNGWATLTLHLIKYLSLVVDQEKRQAESLVKSGLELTGILSSLKSFGAEETFNQYLSSISEKQSKRSELLSLTAMNIEEQLIPILQELYGQIKKKISDPENLWTSLDKELLKDTTMFQKLSTELRGSIMKHQWKGDSMENMEIVKDAPQDPWIANLALKDHIQTCYIKQEKYKNYIQKQEEDLSAFEAAVLQNIKITMSTFYEWRVQASQQNLQDISSVKQRVDNLNPERDWLTFRNSRKNIFVNNLKIPSEIEYDGFDDPLITAVKSGKLTKKEGVFKKLYKPVDVVLTRANYLYIMPEKNLALPDIILDLSDFNLQPLMMNEKEPEEIGLVSKVGGFLGRDVKYKFKGTSIADSADWWGHINEQMKKHEKIEKVKPEKPGLPRNSMDTRTPEPKSDPKSDSPRKESSKDTGKSPEKNSEVTFEPEFGNNMTPIKSPAEEQLYSETKQYKNPIQTPYQQPIYQEPIVQDPYQQPGPVLSITEQMEQMEAKLTPKGAINPEIMDIPEFGTSLNQLNKPAPKKNVWDQFQTVDDGGW